MRSARLFLQLHAPLRELEGLIVLVLHQGDVGLVPADRRQDVTGLHDQREPLRLPQCRHRLVQATFLRERDARQGMDHRQMAPATRRMERRRCLRDVLSDDGRVADLAVAQAQLVMGKPDRAGVMRPFGGRQGFREQGDPARRLAACGGEPTVHPPAVGEFGGVQPLARLGGTPDGLGGLTQIVLQEPGFGQRAPDLDVFLARQPGPLQRPQQQVDGLGPAPLFERLNSLRVRVAARHAR
jgi:hypothetical protein